MAGYTTRDTAEALFIAPVLNTEHPKFTEVADALLVEGRRGWGLDGDVNVREEVEYMLGIDPDEEARTEAAISAAAA